jgi:hypothetical protein
MPPNSEKNIGINKYITMKQVLIFLFLLIIFTGCEPSYRVYVHNTSSSDLYIKTHPSIESLLYDTTSLYYDSIIRHKLKQEGEYGVYRVKPYEKFKILGGIGGGPILNDLSFDYVSLISGSDTVIFDSKEKIIRQIKQIDKKRNFYIEIGN